MARRRRYNRKRRRGSFAFLYKLLAFVLGAFWAGMAGTVYAAKMSTIAPESFNFMESVIIFAVVILSGGSQLGVLVSAFLFIGLPEVLREFSAARMLIFGLAMMIMMIWRPQGLLPPGPRHYAAPPGDVPPEGPAVPRAGDAPAEAGRPA